MRASLSGTLATMGPGTPYAIAARFAYPDRPVIAFVGDGAFQMNGMNEMITVAKYWAGCPGRRLVFCVFNNQDLNQVTWEQRAMAGDPKYPGSQQIPDVPYAPYAELLGLKGVTATTPTRSARRGTRHSPRTSRWSWSSRSTRRSRRSRRTSRVAAGEEDRPRHGPKATPTRSASGEVATAAKVARAPAGTALMGRVIATSTRRSSASASRRTPIPTDAPESDGTLEWDSTTIVVVEVARRAAGPGWATPTPTAAAALIDEHLADSSGGGTRRLAASWRRWSRRPQRRPARGRRRRRSPPWTSRCGT